MTKNGDFVPAWILSQPAILSLHPRNSVIATGGSVVWSRAMMEHLKSLGVIVYLEISFSEMEKRIRNITTRGIVLMPNQTLRGMFDSRVPLYEQYADYTIPCSGEDPESVVSSIITISRQE
jgi:shikimate kinase